MKTRLDQALALLARSRLDPDLVMTAELLARMGWEPSEIAVGAPIACVVGQVARLAREQDQRPGAGGAYDVACREAGARFARQALLGHDVELVDVVLMIEGRADQLLAEER